MNNFVRQVPTVVINRVILEQFSIERDCISLWALKTFSVQSNYYYTEGSWSIHMTRVQIMQLEVKLWTRRVCSLFQNDGPYPFKFLHIS